MTALYTWIKGKTQLTGKKAHGKNLNENWHISTILKKVYSVIQHNSGLNAYLLLVPCATQAMKSHSISYKTKQLPESSSHSESFKCTRGQGGEEWPEETRLRHIQSSCSWLDLHSWWRYWCCNSDTVGKQHWSTQGGSFLQALLNDGERVWRCPSRMVK